MKITSFDQPNVEILRAALDAALTPVAQEHGIKVTVGRIRYRSHNCTVAVEAAVIAADGEAVTREAEDFRRHASFYGLTPEHLNRTFTDPRGRRFILVGLSLKARKNPFIIADVEGKRFVAPETMVLRGFGLPLPSRGLL